MEAFPSQVKTLMKLPAFPNKKSHEETTRYEIPGKPHLSVIEKNRDLCLDSHKRS